MSSIPERNMAGSGELTPLQMHSAFFDRNNDGVIYPWETFQGLRAIGCGILLSLPVTLIINGFLALKTKTGIIPSPLLPIYLKNIQKGKHGSDTDSYDSEGRFVPAKFEEIFQKHAHTNPNALTSDEISELLADDQEPNDYVGWAAAFLEWRLLYFLCKDKNGFLQKDTVRAVYDGSLFVQLEKERASSQKNKA